MHIYWGIFNSLRWAATDNPPVIVINYSIYLQHNRKGWQKGRGRERERSRGSGSGSGDGEITQVFTRQPVGSCVLSTCRITNEFLCKLQSPCSWQHGSTLNFFAASPPTPSCPAPLTITPARRMALEAVAINLWAALAGCSPEWATCLPC